MQTEMSSVWIPPQVLQPRSPVHFNPEKPLSITSWLLHYNQKLAGEWWGQVGVFPLQLLYLSFMPLRAISPPAIHNLNAVECSEDEEGSSYPDSYRNQHP